MREPPSDLRRKRPTVSLERLREMFSLDPLTGIFIRNRRMGHHRAGTVAGNISAAHGYVFISIDGQLYRGHRLAWFHYYGEWPPADLEPDHKNRIRSDNRKENLRLATRSQNTGNAARRRDNTSGCRGVSWSTQRQRWRVVIAGRHVGFFKMKRDAIAAANVACTDYYGEFARVA